MKKLISLTFLAMALLGSGLAQASITCHTPRQSKVLIIEESKVSISQPFQLENERSVASVTGIRTKLLGNGFTKVMFHNGVKHIIHIEDKAEFSAADDYLILRSAEGHEMTYPLECQ